MHGDDHSEQPTAERDTRSTALVPVAETARWSRFRPLPRPDSVFLSHLIAASEPGLQTGGLRRASASDASAAYTANRHRTGAGLRPRQVA